MQTNFMRIYVIRIRVFRRSFDSRLASCVKRGKFMIKNKNDELAELLSGHKKFIENKYLYGLPTFSSPPAIDFLFTSASASDLRFANENIHDI